MAQTAFDIGQLAEQLAQGYYAHSAAIAVAAHPEAVRLVPATLPGHAVPVGFVRRKDGTEHAFDFIHFLKTASASSELAEALPRVWLAGSLLTLGDELSRHQYFDHAPILELLYHLRNGIAHGNRFEFRRAGLERLKKYPANNRNAYVQSALKIVFEITPALAGERVLFDYLGPGDVLDILLSVGHHLITFRTASSP
jgi:hypothetical protein